MGPFEVKILQAEENAMMQMMENAMQGAMERVRPQFFLEEEILTVEEAAKFCKMSRSTLDNMVREGIITPHRPGKHPRFLKSELIDFVKNS